MESTVEKIKFHYGYLFELNLLDEIIKVGNYRKLKEGDAIISYGDTIKYMPLLINGSIKVFREDEKENEVLLYYLEKGDTCAMSLSCCLGNKKSEILAVVEEDCEVILLPIKYMGEWICKYETWKSFVFNSYNSRLDEMLKVIDSLAFMKMDERLYKHLKDKCMVIGSFELSVNHRKLASELNTSREVISRLLKKMEIDGKIVLKRNLIVLNESEV
ncbi:Crp/Fnr family transcriptional regulator [Flavobacteriales bacterium]|jgi:CRP/FNR family transcriptional regulator|nr:Crp/Fnr family transcriptional regulator [Flavobacteriales bacterium]